MGDRHAHCEGKQLPETLTRIFSISRQTIATANFILQCTHAQIITTYCTGLITDKPNNMTS